MANARKVIMRTKVSLFDSVGTLEEETHDDYIASSSIGSVSTNGRWAIVLIQIYHQVKLVTGHRLLRVRI